MICVNNMGYPKKEETLVNNTRVLQFLIQKKRFRCFYHDILQVSGQHLQQQKTGPLRYNIG